MKSTLIVVLALLGLSVLASAHRGGGHHPGEGWHKGGHPHEHNGNNQHKCSYKNTNGYTFDFGCLASKDMIVEDMVTGSTYHFNPCGAVHATQCPEGAAVCEITNTGEAISHGAAYNAHWADGVGEGVAVEITYGGGEMCAEGEHRKTAVEMRCLAGGSGSDPSYLLGVMKQDCLLTLFVESPLACDKQAICSAISDEAACKGHNMCEWKGTCVASSRKEYHHWGSHRRTTIIISAVVGFSAVVFLCCAVTCVCIACRRAAHRRKLRRLHKKAKKASAKGKAMDEEMNLINPETFEPVVVPEPPHSFQPFAMQQAADGSFVPVPIPPVPHAYSYPMVQFIPAYHLQHHQAQQQ